jgi:hypothetical protein
VIAVNYAARQAGVRKHMPVAQVCVCVCVCVCALWRACGWVGVFRARVGACSAHMRPLSVAVRRQTTRKQAHHTRRRRRRPHTARAHATAPRRRARCLRPLGACSRTHTPRRTGAARTSPTGARAPVCVRVFVCLRVCVCVCVERGSEGVSAKAPQASTAQDSTHTRTHTRDCCVTHATLVRWSVRTPRPRCTRAGRRRAR